MKDKIKEIVDTYILENSADYQAVCEYIIQNRKKLSDAQFGGGQGYFAMYEIPEELNNKINQALSAEEQQEFAKLEHKKWFANSFPQFRLPDEV